MKSLITLIALLAIAGGAMAQKTALPQLKIVGKRDANPMCSYKNSPWIYGSWDKPL